MPTGRRLLRILRILRIPGFYFGAPMSNNHPNGKSSPGPFHTAVPQTLGVYRGLPRRSPSGRRQAHPFAQTSQTGQTGQTGLTQAPRPRSPHTAVAIKLPCIPQRQIFARAIPNCGKQTLGVYRGAPTCQTGQTGQTGQTQAPRPRNTHTAVAIKLPCITLR